MSLLKYVNCVVEYTGVYYKDIINITYMSTPSLRSLDRITARYYHHLYGIVDNLSSPLFLIEADLITRNRVSSPVEL